MWLPTAVFVFLLPFSYGFFLSWLRNTPVTCWLGLWVPVLVLPPLLSWFVILFLPRSMPQTLACMRGCVCVYTRACTHIHAHAQANVQDVCGCHVFSGLLSFSCSSSLSEEIPLSERLLIYISRGCTILSEQSASRWLPFPQALVCIPCSVAGSLR